MVKPTNFRTSHCFVTFFSSFYLRIHSPQFFPQTMSLCLTCISRSLDCIPRSFSAAAGVVQRCLPSHVHPAGGSVMLQLLLTVLYEELQLWAKRESRREKQGEYSSIVWCLGTCKLLTSELSGENYLFCVQ